MLDLSGCAYILLYYVSYLCLMYVLICFFFIFSLCYLFFFFFFSSRRRHTRSTRDWSSDVCSSDLLSADVVVRPDGKISLPLLNDVEAAGFTPDQLRARLIEAASKYIEEPNATEIGRASCRERV